MRALFTLYGRTIDAEFTATRRMPAVMYLSNGDPGYPAEGGEIEFSKLDIDGEPADFDSLPTDLLEDIEAECYAHYAEAQEEAAADYAIEAAYDRTWEAELPLGRF